MGQFTKRFIRLSETFYPKLLEQIVIAAQERLEKFDSDSTDISPETIEEILEGIMPVKNPSNNAFLTRRIRSVVSRSYSSIISYGLKNILENDSITKNTTLVYTPGHLSQADLLLGVTALEKIQDFRPEKYPPLVPAFARIFQIPVIKQILLSANLMPNQRRNPTALYRNIWASYIMTELSQQDLLVFPQGTRKRDGKLTEFRKEYISYLMTAQLVNPELDINIVPLGLGYYPPDGIELFKGTVFEDRSNWFYLFELSRSVGMFTKGGEYGEAHLNFGVPIPISDYLKDIKVGPDEMLAEFLRKNGDYWNHVKKAASSFVSNLEKKVQYVTPVLSGQLVCQVLKERGIADHYELKTEEIQSALGNLRAELVEKGAHVTAIPINSDDILAKGIKELEIYKVKTNISGNHLAISNAKYVIEYVSNMVGHYFS